MQLYNRKPLICITLNRNSIRAYKYVASMQAWCTSPALVQGVGSSIALASILAYLDSFVFIGSIIGMLIHQCFLIGYANPLNSTLFYVAVAHSIGYTAVSTLHAIAHKDAFLPTTALGVTIILVGTIFAILSRSATKHTAPFEQIHPQRYTLEKNETKPSPDLNDISETIPPNNTTPNWTLEPPSALQLHVSSTSTRERHHQSPEINEFNDFL